MAETGGWADGMPVSGMSFKGRRGTARRGRENSGLHRVPKIQKSFALITPAYEIFYFFHRISLLLKTKLNNKLTTKNCTRSIRLQSVAVSV